MVNDQVSYIWQKEVLAQSKGDLREEKSEGSHRLSPGLMNKNCILTLIVLRIFFQKSPFVIVSKYICIKYL